MRLLAPEESYLRDTSPWSIPDLFLSHGFWAHMGLAMASSKRLDLGWMDTTWVVSNSYRLPSHAWSPRRVWLPVLGPMSQCTSESEMQIAVNKALLSLPLRISSAALCEPIWEVICHSNCSVFNFLNQLDHGCRVQCLAWSPATSCIAPPRSIKYATGLSKDQRNLGLSKSWDLKELMFFFKLKW